MNLSLLPLFYLSLTPLTTADPGWLEPHRRPGTGQGSLPPASRASGPQISTPFFSWTGPCVKCGKIRKDGAGLFCGNFSIGREDFPPCQVVWCGKCYREQEGDPYPRRQDLKDDDEENEGWDGEETEEDKDRYRCARDGDYLMGVPFECDLCHFRNLNHRNPKLKDARDVRTLWAIRRASLDACWAREPGTVRGNFNRMRADYRDARSMYTFRDTLPRLGNPRLEDRSGMGEALYFLAASLRKGRYTKHIQYATTRRTSSWLTNLEGARSTFGAAGGGIGDDGGFGRREESKRDTTWLARFMRGMKLRMGEVRFQNEAFMSDMAVALHHFVSKAWSEEEDEERRESLESLMCYVLIGLGAGLRGEEVPLTSWIGLQTFWTETEEDPDPYVMITLRGRFKTETGERWHCLPICDNNRSQIPYRTWIRRLLRRRVNEAEGNNEWLLRGKEGRRAKISDYNEMFCDYMSMLRNERPDVFSTGTLMDMFSLRRSMRRGAIVATTGERVQDSVVQLINRWRMKENAKGTEPGLNMHQTYSQVRSMYTTLKAYSKAI